MALQSLVSETYNSFQRHTANTQVVLLHPESRLRSMLVAHLLNESPMPVFYYAMGSDDVNLPAFLDGFSHDMAIQHPTFGRHLYQFWHNADEDLTPLVDAFIKDLAELHSDQFMLVLDEFDASRDADDVQVFWERIVRYLPPNCQLVINSRTIPRMPWVSLIARQQAVILKDGEAITENFYRTTPENPVAHLDAFGLGPGFVHKDGEPIDEWEGHLPRLLFFFVLARPLVTRSEICNTFWPNLDSDQAVNVFHVTKRRLHKALGFDVLVHHNGYYQINPDATVNYDIEDFVTALARARQASPEDSLSYWQKAADSYRGPFLQGHTEEWVVEQREDFLAGYLEAMTAIAKVRLDEGRKEQALALLLRAANENDLYEPIHIEIMRLYAHLGRRSEAAGHYQKLVEMMKEQGLEPSPRTQQIYGEIMS
jgi:DNA-binding SARP family transcriptional activator